MVTMAMQETMEERLEATKKESSAGVAEAKQAVAKEAAEREAEDKQITALFQGRCEALEVAADLARREAEEAMRQGLTELVADATVERLKADAQATGFTSEIMELQRRCEQAEAQPAPRQPAPRSVPHAEFDN